VDLQESGLPISETMMEPQNQLLKEVIVCFYTNFFFLLRLKTMVKVIDFTG